SISAARPAPVSRDERTADLSDPDGPGTKRNKLVAVVAALALAGAPPLQGTIDPALAAGTVIQLLDVASLDPQLQQDTALTVSGYAGALPKGADPMQLYSGDARVDVDVSELPA